MKIKFKGHIKHMFYYKTIFQYIGSNYSGFQFQNNCQTIQGEINTALSKIHTKKMTTIAASRTDTGVHAVEQLVKFSFEKSINDISRFLNSLNSVLPSDIKCQSIIVSDYSYRPTLKTKAKVYKYLFTNKKEKINPEESRFFANIANELQFEKIQKCILMLEGEHSFANFYSRGSNVKSTIRTIAKCEMKQINPQELFSGIELFDIPKNITNCYEITFIANGFLKQMIRHIVSKLWLVGSGKLSVEEFQELLKANKELKSKGKVSPANGLYLFKIDYF